MKAANMAGLLARHETGALCRCGMALSRAGTRAAALFRHAAQADDLWQVHACFPAVTGIANLWN
ncbi:hypothetical protein [Azorhizobium oxalatiphilum]|uniref:hypothetical protein n=1 Tax=Azorhizobium oxalatiphilum TaxID=980631 RepID=UPI00166BC550|nr:hypothetical protein [Azorhizobium oxalatiphilum]